MQDLAGMAIHPEVVAQIEADNAAFAALVESILADESQLLHASTEILLSGEPVSIHRDDGAVWAATTDPGTDQALLTIYWQSSTRDAAGNSVISLSLRPISRLTDRIPVMLAVAIANVIVNNRKDSRGMTHRRLVQVTWDPNRPDEFGVYFTDASADSRPGNRADAQALADSHGFQFVDSTDETLLWKLPDSDWMGSIRNYRPGPNER